jgi:O-antigen/teichoic acid export membrane protein
MIGEILIAVGGFISFPIYTRMLTIEEYGIMSLVTITLAIFEALFSAGFRPASQRFFSQYTNKNQFQQFYSTIILSSLAFGMFGTLSVFLLSRLLSFLGILSNDIYNILTLASLLIGIRIMAQIIGCFFRAREEAGIYSFFAVLTKYVRMSLAIIFVTVFLYGLFGFFVGIIVGEFVVLCFYAFYMIQKMGSPTGNYSTVLLKEMISYGLPIVFSGYALLILRLGDRYLVGYFLSVSDVANYSVPYNLCDYITGIIVTAFQFAFFPMIMNLWNQGKHAQVDLQVRSAIRYYCMIALPMIFGTIALGDQLIVFFASEKYSGTSHILPYVIIGVMLQGLFLPLMIGLHFSKKTQVMLKLSWWAAFLNITMNIILIPAMGILGAAIATLFSYVALLIAGAITSSKYFKVKIPWHPISNYFLSAIAMFLFVKILEGYALSDHLFSLILSGVLAYSLILISIDTQLRTAFLCFLIKKARKNG